MYAGIMETNATDSLVSRQGLYGEGEVVRSEGRTILVDVGDA